ncbi:MAG: 6-phosphogluconolactonase [Cyclobacteriaceae bacterium]
MIPKLKTYNTPDLVASSFAEWLYESVSQHKGIFTIALSGGSTPAMIFKLLAKDYKEKMPWHRMRFFWSDERCVLPDDDQSNYKMAHSLLLYELNLDASNVFRVRGENFPADEALAYAEIIEAMVPANGILPSFDLIMLGLGEDGHTASIFPGQEKLWKDDNLCVAVQHPQSGQYRISFSGKLINAAHRVAFIATGEKKSSIVEAILKQKTEAEKYPASWVAPTSKDLYWFLDSEANKLVQ